jgi:hypothetical protein
VRKEHVRLGDMDKVALKSNADKSFLSKIFSKKSVPIKRQVVLKNRHEAIKR